MAFRLTALQTLAIVCGFLIDFFVGDPHIIPHPVVGMGKLISLLDRRLRIGNSDPRDVGRGIVAVVIVATVSTALPAAVLAAAWAISPWAYFAVETIMCWQLIAARQLVRESARVERALERGDTQGARHAVSMIVGRDTDGLDDGGICRAAVETVAENCSDGVTAPLFWIALFGAVGGFFYKSVNTMDSMIGYKNERYLFFGRAAARTDDAVNYIPARLTAWLMIAACPLTGLDVRGAVRIYRRDRRKHESPNSAQTESVCAGALGVRLAGDAAYGGVLRKKEYIGDPARGIVPGDIKRAGTLMYAASALMLVCIVIIRTVILICF